MECYTVGNPYYPQNHQQSVKNSHLPLETVSINLQQRFAKEDLIPSLDGTRFYTRGLWCSLLRLIYVIADRVFGYELFKTNKQKVEEETPKAFNIHKEQAFLALNSYVQHIKSLGGIDHNDPVDKDLYENRIRTLTSWNQWITPYLDEKTSDKEDWIKFKQIECLQNLIRLESLLNTPLPIPIILKVANSTFEKIAEGEELNENEKTLFTSWILEINKTIELNKSLPKRTHQLTITLFQKALEVLLTIFSGNDRGSVETVLLSLDIHGCQLFATDPEQLEFRKEVKEKRQITIQEKTYRLAEPLSLGKNDSKDCFHVYQIENYEVKDHDFKNYVLVVPKRRTLLATDRFAEIKYEQPLRLLDTIEQDCYGRFKTRPYIPLALNGYKWSEEKLTYKEDKIIQGLAVVIKKFIDEQWTPHNLHVKHIMCDEQQRLFSTHSYATHPTDDAYSYISLENFAFACSGGKSLVTPSGSNSLVFRSIMKASKLDQQPEMTFFNELVKKAIQDTSPPDASIITQLIQLHIKKDKKTLDEKAETQLKEKGLELVKVCKEHKDSILQAVEKHNISNDNQLVQIKKLYLEEYKKLGYGCILNKDLVNQVIENYK